MKEKKILLVNITSFNQEVNGIIVRPFRTVFVPEGTKYNEQVFRSVDDRSVDEKNKKENKK